MLEGQVRSSDPSVVLPLVHRSAFCQFSFRWIYYCHSSKSTGKETEKMHLCVVCYMVTRPVESGNRQMALVNAILHQYCRVGDSRLG